MAFLVRTYWFALLCTLLVFATVFAWGGPAVLFPVIVLTFLELTFSADNAVINSKVLVTLSPLWQRLFMTLGIFIAVFVVRFVAPIVMVMLTAGLGFEQVMNLALHDPHRYEQEIMKAEPLINAFGGTFLLMIALSYFIDYEKKTHWLKWLEQRLGKLGQFDNITTFLMLLAAIVLFFTVDDAHKAVVLIAAVCAMALHSGLGLVAAIFEKSNKRAVSPVQKTGWLAFSAFMYLEVLDASFSLDGIVGAFAISSSVLVIVAGLSAGAVWVRAMTIHLVRAKVLNRYVFLEHGAHWAIAFLGVVMLLKLYSFEFPDWLVGSLSLVTIAVALAWSKQTEKVVKQ